MYNKQPQPMLLRSSSTRLNFNTSYRVALTALCLTLT
eukprot:COSAG06_NODE_3001_length_5977_cov_16.775264_7_plen_37_part_00